MAYLGSYDMTETVPAGWALTDVKCKTAKGSKWARSGTGATLTLAAGENVTCTFTNTKLASLTVVKNTVGGDGAFQFTSQTLTPAAFRLTTTGGTAQRVFAGLAPGAYDVAEAAPAGPFLTSRLRSDWTKRSLYRSGL